VKKSPFQGVFFCTEGGNTYY